MKSPPGSIMPKIPLSWSGLSAMIGGLLWIIKGGAILITGDQPPVVFEAASFFFLLALLGLNHLLGVKQNLRTFAVVLIYAGLLANVLLVIFALFLPDSFPDGEEFAFPVSLFIIISGLSWIVSLLCLGWITYRSGQMPRKHHKLPLALGLLFPLVIVAGGLMEAINERLLELPLVLYACVWIYFGYILLQISAERISSATV